MNFRDEKLSEMAHVTIPRLQDANFNLLTANDPYPLYEEWFRTPAKIVAGHKATVTLPAGTTHYVMNLIDENNFLRSYPDLPDMSTLSKTKAKYSVHALSAKPPVKTHATQ